MQNATLVGISAAATLLLNGMATDFDLNQIGGIDFARQFLGKSNVPAGIVGNDGHMVICNKAMEDFLGRKESQLRLLHFKDFTVKEYIEADLYHFNELLNGMLDHYDMTKAWERPDYTHAVGDMTVTPIAPNGKILGMHVTISPQHNVGLGKKILPISGLDDEHKVVTPLQSNERENILILMMRELVRVDKKWEFVLSFCVLMFFMWLFGGDGFEYLVDRFFPHPIASP